MIAIDREWLPTGEPSPELLWETLRQFDKIRLKLCGLKAFYDGEHAVQERWRAKGAPNHRLWHDLPGYIVALTSGYLLGEPVQYAAEQKEELEPLRAALKKSVSANVDSELAVDAAVYGRGVELYYADDHAAPRLCQADARNAFVVYDNTIEHEPVYGVLITDKLNGQFQKIGQRISVMTDEWVVLYERVGEEMPHETSRERHFFGRVPMTEFWNNERERGDFEGVMNLIDAYDALQSNRINDKQQFTDALMVIYGATVEEDEEGRSLQQRLRETKTLEMPASDARVEYLTKTLSESDTEVLKNSLKADIHKLSFAPDLTDEAFAGNVSGVAMEYKLFGLEQLTRGKERWFREGLYNRLRCMLHFLQVRGYRTPEAEDIDIVFSRSLPVNKLEVAQTLRQYEGMVPKRLLLSQVPFVENAETAMEEMIRETKEKTPGAKANGVF
ncbi:MAG: phage portal protein [Eubacteriales bacterium]|nr:phage portal protein [Eubacteriales bacterium]